MRSLLAVLPALGCVVMMPAMMWAMSRMRRDDSPPPPPPLPPTGAARSVDDEELHRLRDEVARLRSEVDADARRRQPADG